MNRKTRPLGMICILSLLLLCGCVIKSKSDIIKNDSATIMFGGQQNLLWVSHDGQQMILERLSGKKDRTYLATAVDDPSEATRVRFLDWPDFDLMPGEHAYIAVGEFSEGKNKEKIWYYELLTNDQTKNIWTRWSFDPPDGKEIEVKTLEEIKSTLEAMMESKHFKRRELIVFRAASEHTRENLKQ